MNISLMLTKSSAKSGDEHSSHLQHFDLNYKPMQLQNFYFQKAVQRKTAKWLVSNRPEEQTKMEALNTKLLLLFGYYWYLHKGNNVSMFIHGLTKPLIYLFLCLQSIA